MFSLTTAAAVGRGPGRGMSDMSMCCFKFGPVEEGPREISIAESLGPCDIPQCGLVYSSFCLSAAAAVSSPHHAQIVMGVLSGCETQVTWVTMRDASWGVLCTVSMVEHVSRQSSCTLT